MKSYPQLPGFQDVSHKTRFYFVRHGESEANKKHLIQGHLDAALSETGRAQAGAAARWFADREVDAVFSSPLARTAETATAIASAAKVTEVISSPLLLELNTGLFSGLSFSEIESRYPEHYRRFQRYSWEAVPEAERIAELTSRAFAVWRMMIDAANSGRRSLVAVTHGGMIQWLIRASMGPLDHAWMPIFKASNCGIFLLTVRPVAAASDLCASYFASWDLVDHLPYGSMPEEKTP